MERGVFFSLDGVDGAGKSTQVSMFCEWLTGQGHRVVACRDPGSTPLGEAVRGLLLDRRDLTIGRRGEMLLYMAARAQLVDEVIRPALERGESVVSDRFLLANVVYQAHAGGLDVGQVWEVGQIATAGVSPDLTFVLDLEVNVAIGRLNRQPDRMEAQGPAFLARVREGFRAEAARQPDRIVLIDAARDPQSVQAEIRQIAMRRLAK
jgi:dTMP kinase